MPCMRVRDSCQVEQSGHVSNNYLEQNKPRDWEATISRLKNGTNNTSVPANSCFLEVAKA